MKRITLSNDQLRLVAGARDPIAVHDENGHIRGYIAMIVTEDELSDARKALAAGAGRYTTAEVLAKLRSQVAP
jgi:hypothetical protein